MKKLTPDVEKKIHKHIIRKLVRRTARGKHVYIPKQQLRDGLPPHLGGHLNNTLDKMWKRGEIAFSKGRDTVFLLLSDNEIEKVLTE